jgi:hypothetical protein
MRWRTPDAQPPQMPYHSALPTRIPTLTDDTFDSPVTLHTIHGPTVSPSSPFASLRFSVTLASLNRTTAAQKHNQQESPPLHQDECVGGTTGPALLSLAKPPVVTRRRLVPEAGYEDA